MRHRQEADAESNLPVWWSRETQINLKHTPRRRAVTQFISRTRTAKCWLSPNTAGFILHSFVYSTKLFYHTPYASTFQVHPQNGPFQAASTQRPFSSFQPLAAAETSVALRPHSYYLVTMTTIVKKCYGYSEKFRHPPHNIVVKHVHRRVERTLRIDNTKTGMGNGKFVD